MFFIPSIIAFFYELILMIPVLGGTIIIASGYTAITTALVIHVIVLIMRFVTGHSKIVPILAILLTFLTWIPFLGWTIHVILTILYFIDILFGLMKSPS